MVRIDFNNIEKLVFRDLELQSKLPAFKDLFQQWKLGLSVPALRPTGQKALLDFLNQLGDEQIRTLEEYFGTQVIIEKLDYNLVKNDVVSLLEAQERIESLNIKGEMFLHRDANHLYIGSWV